MKTQLYKLIWPLAVPALLSAPRLASAQAAAPANTGTANATVNANTTATSDTTATADAKTPDQVFPQGILFPYDLLDRALNGNMDDHGNVDYLALRGNPNLALFVRGTQSADLSAFPVWKEKDEQGNERLDRSAELVFWINAYNAHVLKTIADAYPVKSVAGIPDFYTAKTHVIAGKPYSFEELRAKIAAMDPRAFFALTDGTKGGPLLAPSAYRWTGLSRSLDAAVSAFVNDARNVELTRIQDHVVLSEFFREADPFFQMKLKDSKWSGIHYLLMTYTTQSASRKYFATNDYHIDFKRKDDTLNNKNL
jgi:hypothetical protein